MSENDNMERVEREGNPVVEESNLRTEVMNSENKFTFPASSLLFYLAGFSSIAYGFYKMLVYENSDSIFRENVNAYVGGDAYNYIINSNYFVGFNVLGLTLIIIATSIVITRAINTRRN